MKDILPEIGFKQFPISLKLVAIGMGLLGLVQILTFAFKLFNGAGFAGYDLISGIAYFALMFGLITRRNIIRILTMLWALIEFLKRAFILGLVIFSKEVKFDPFEIKLFTFRLPLSDPQWIILWSLLLVIIVGIFLVLLSPRTKAVFSDQPIQQEST